MQIQWFPGHMTRTLRQVQEKLRYVDIVFELRDARIPYSSSNPKIDSICQNKPRLILFNKAKMADDKVTNAWINYYKGQGITCLAIDSISGYNIDKIVPTAKNILKDLFEKEKAKGMKERPIKALILGIPNVGKSTLINTLAKRKVAQTGNKPGVTKNLQWINVNNELMLLDTPGVLWPKFDDKEVGLKLAVTGAIKDEILPLDTIALYALSFLKQHYPEKLLARYKLETLSEDNIEIMDQIALNRGCLLPGKRIHYDRVIDIILYEIRNDLLGNISWETPDILKEKRD
ncbi:MAG: ribosome biogenesis GTPase YlqF [Bacilli bacterium]|nr:ribosome biogenesis GTPase YlqF [Bacilli bacterium]